MCGRYYAGGDFAEKLMDILEEEDIAAAEPVYDRTGQDVLPSELSTVIAEEGGGLAAVNMHWGFDAPRGNGLLINARAETAREKQTFSDSVLHRRCVIPASGFYEWDRDRTKYRFTRPDGGLLLLAGFYTGVKGEQRYTILTTEANDSMRPVHDRMPLTIGRDEIRPWIKDAESLTEFLTRPQGELVRTQDSGQIRMDLGI